MNQGSGLQLGQQQLRADIAHNLRQLIQEKTVIQTTHSQLRTLAKKLTDQLGKLMCMLCSLILSVDLINTKDLLSQAKVF